MKIKNRAEDASTLHDDGWLQMGQWLAEIRQADQDDQDEPPGDVAGASDSAVWPDGAGQARPQVFGPTAGLAAAEAPARDRDEDRILAAARAIAETQAATRARVLARAHAEAEARALADAQAEARALALAQAEARARAAARGRPSEWTSQWTSQRTSAGPSAHDGAMAQALIGDELRRPVLWCELGSCISWYADRAAFGEADTRARAIAAGWRIDALGRLACPDCQQHDPGFWTTAPLVPWDRRAALARAASASQWD